MTLEEVLAMLADIFEYPLADLTLQTAQEEIPGWDSMGVLSIMAEFDDRFSLLLTPEQLQSLKVVDDIVDILRTNNKLV